MPDARTDARPSIARGFAAGATAEIASLLLTLVLTVIVSRVLGPSGRGVYFVTILVATLTAYVSDLGLSAAAITFAAAREQSVRALHTLAIAVSVVAAALSAGVFLPWSSWWSSTVFEGLTPELLAIAVAGVAPLAYAQLASAMLVGAGGVTQLAALRVGASALTLAATALALGVANGGVRAACVAWLIGTTAFAAALAVTLFRRRLRPTVPTIGDVRSISSFALRTYVGTLAHHGFLRIDILFVSAQLGPAAVGNYSLASVLAERISLVGGALYNATASYIGGVGAANAALITTRVVRLLVVFLVPLVTLLAVLAYPLITLVFGDAFRGAVLPFMILLPGAAALTAWYVIGLYIVSALRRPAFTSAVQAGAFICCVPLYVAAISLFGIEGAAAVSSVTYASVFVAGIAFVVAKQHVRPREFVPSRADAAIARDVVAGVFRRRPRAQKSASQRQGHR